MAFNADFTKAVCDWADRQSASCSLSEVGLTDREKRKKPIQRRKQLILVLQQKNKIKKRHHCRADKLTSSQITKRSVGECSDIQKSWLKALQTLNVCQIKFPGTSKGDTEAHSRQHGPSLVRWDCKQEPNPLWCCWGKCVTRSILSRMSAFFRQHTATVSLCLSKTWVCTDQHAHYQIKQTCMKRAWALKTRSHQLHMKIEHSSGSAVAL